MKLFYRKKGTYSDGRDKIVIEDRNTNQSRTLPKPEILWELLDKTPNTDSTKEK